MDDFGNDLGLFQSGDAIDAMARFILDGLATAGMLTDRILQAYRMV